jgi:Fur family ferric uptake transcriptional regulator
LILEAVQGSPGHLSAEDVYRKVRATYPYLNMSTVYRTLELLKELRLVTVADLGGACIRYEVVGAQPHHHAVCQRCGTMYELSDRFLEGFKAELERAYGFVPDIDHLVISGTCARCRQALVSREREGTSGESRG